MGFGLGTGMAAAFFEMTLRKIATRGIILMWHGASRSQAAVILFVVIIASLLEYPARHRFRGVQQLFRG